MVEAAVEGIDLNVILLFIGTLVFVALLIMR
jgi:hypothetical protein